ncbi:MAG TPA: hypothetical protein PKU96_01400 [bacterium]|jgi:hypothetical protein|nr:hypothetical protein [Myxococcales bacterium]OQA58706.1 MAG: hypothetical protein BWY40_01425 [bacterium ADurb.Bin270]HPW45009.1 hypothetical protein [bacterium]HQC50685.1 hypothetical protein [bacterium]HQH80887.1 hypothetical protein [bacterium]
MRFKILFLAVAPFVIFPSVSLYASVADKGDDPLQARGGFSRAPAYDADDESPAVVEISVLRRGSQEKNKENRDEQDIFGSEPPGDDIDNSIHRGD